MDKDGPIALDGQWELYWDRLLSPDDFKVGGAPPPPSGFLTLPGSWKGVIVDGRPLGGTGQATLRLRVRLPDSGEVPLGLRLYALSVAYRLWINGMPATASGRVGRDAATEEPRRSLELAQLPSGARELDLVLQISNYHFNRGGVTSPIILDSLDGLERDRLRTWAPLW